MAAEDHGISLIALRTGAEPDRPLRHRIVFFSIWTERAAALAPLAIVVAIAAAALSGTVRMERFGFGSGCP